MKLSIVNKYLAFSTGGHKRNSLVKYITNFLNIFYSMKNKENKILFEESALVATWSRLKE